MDEKNIKEFQEEFCKFRAKFYKRYFENQNMQVMVDKLLRRSGRHLIFFYLTLGSIDWSLEKIVENEKTCLLDLVCAKRYLKITKDLMDKLSIVAYDFYILLSKDF